VRYAKGTGKLTTWLSNTRATSAVFGRSNKPARLAHRTTWMFSARAHDGFGNVTAWSPTKRVKLA
jgi:hypothetical protein